MILTFPENGVKFATHIMAPAYWLRTEVFRWVVERDTGRRYGEKMSRVIMYAINEGNCVKLGVSINAGK